MKDVPIVFDIVEFRLIQFVLYKYIEFLEYILQYPDKNDTNLPTDISLINNIGKKCDENNITFKLKRVFGNHSQYNVNFSEKEFKALYDMLYMVLTIFTEEVTTATKEKVSVLTNLHKLEKKLVAIKEAYNITGYKYTDKPLVKYPITDSKISKEREIKEKENYEYNQKTINIGIFDVFKNNSDTAVLLSKAINKNHSKEIGFMTYFEVFAYLTCLTLSILDDNNVDKDIRQSLTNISWNGLGKSKMWVSLNFSKDELDKFFNNRIENYANILNEFKELNDDYYNRIIEYQTQLISDIIKNNRFSYYYSLPKNITDLDLHLTDTEKNSLKKIIIEEIIPLTKRMKEDYTNCYFKEGVRDLLIG